MDIIDPITITDGMLLSSNVLEDDYPEYDPGYVYDQGDLVIVTAAGVHQIFEQAQGVSHTVTVTIPGGVFTWAGHGLTTGKPIRLETTGALASPLVAADTYYVTDPTTDTFKLSATPGGTAIVLSGSQSGIHTAVANEIGKDPVTQATYWTKKTATNRWAMFDRYSVTATENAESVEVEIAWSGIAGGIYLTGLVGDEVELTLTDADDGVVYNKVSSLIQSNSASSFWRWCFGRTIRKQSFVAIDFPPYLDSTLKIAIRKPGGVAKCAMCVVGPRDYVADTEFGFGGSYEDYSTTTVSLDGDVNTVLRPWVRTLSFPLSVRTGDAYDSAWERLMACRGRFVVFVGTKDIRMSVVYARMTGLRTIVPGRAFSQLSLDVKGGI